MRAHVGVPISPDPMISRTRTIGAWKRKFSWTAKNTPAFSAASTMARQSSQHRRHRLLDDGRDAGGDRGFDQSAVGVHPGGDVDKVDAALGEKRGRVRIPARDVELRRGRFGPGGVGIADRGDLHPFRRKLAP